MILLLLQDRDGWRTCGGLSESECTTWLVLFWVNNCDIGTLLLVWDATLLFNSYLAWHFFLILVVITLVYLEGMLENVLHFFFSLLSAFLMFSQRRFIDHDIVLFYCKKRIFQPNIKVFPQYSRCPCTCMLGNDELIMVVRCLCQGWWREAFEPSELLKLLLLVLVSETMKRKYYLGLNNVHSVHNMFNLCYTQNRLRTAFINNVAQVSSNTLSDSHTTFTSNLI